jgi:glycosyltransferase involved in cell wall biosynthesis
MPARATVSAIIPARDEESTIARVVASLAPQPEILEIIVVNDQSSDGTAARLNELAKAAPQLRVVEAGELPPGWVGKNHAVALGAMQAKGEWLLFTDADAVHLPGSTSRALADAESCGAAMVSYSPEQETPTWWERMLIPFIYVRLARHFSYAEVNDPASPVAAANGQFLVIRRDVYEAIGGHCGIAGAVLDDVALARRVKQAGYALHFASGQGIVRVRMYRSFAPMWQGWTKNLYPLMCAPPAAANAGAATGSVVGLCRELGAAFPWEVAAFLLFGALNWAWLLAGLAMLAVRHVLYGATLRRNRFPISRIQYYAPAILLYSAALIVSAWRYSRGTVVWKGREYPIGMPGA